jgi:hypothetical protein
MQSRLAIFSSAILLSLASLAHAQSSESAPYFTLQVASFPDMTLAEEFAARLAKAGEKPGWGTVDLPGRGRWTRVFIGSFKSIEAAHQYGAGLVWRRVIKEYLVKTAGDVKSLSRPRTATGNNVKALPDGAQLNKPPLDTAGGDAATAKNKAGSNLTPDPLPAQALAVSSRIADSADLRRAFLPDELNIYCDETLPVAPEVKLWLAPSAGLNSMPRRDAARMAFNLISGSGSQKGGLWVTGDRKEGLSRLRWIVGSDNADLISLDESGRVRLDRKLLEQAAGAGEAAALEAPLVVAGYINSNEGLLLLVQLAQGQYRYCLHIGRQAQTAGGVVEVSGSANLDNNYDSRINPYRHSGKKLDKELPPAAFDSLVVINPVARWFNLRTNSLVPVAHITFHELAEAHAKLEMRLDYLEHGSQPGAHNVAISREERLKSQRPLSDVILTLGSNRVLRSEEELRLFYSQFAAAGGSKR